MLGKSAGGGVFVGDLKNVNFPESSRFVAWALERSKAVKVTYDPEPIECDGKLYQATYKQWSGTVGKKATHIYGEIGVGRVYLVNEFCRQVWIENPSRYVSDYGRLDVGEVLFSIASCGRCGEELDDISDARLNACGDCWELVTSDPEAALDAWVKGEWGV